MAACNRLAFLAALFCLTGAKAQADSVYGNDPLTVNVLVLNFDPLVAGGRIPSRLHAFAGWQNPRTLADNYANNVRAASGGFIDYQIAEWRDLDDIPTKQDGYDYTTSEYVQNMSSGNWHSPDTADYVQVLNDHGVPELIDNETIDEVWMFGGPYFGYWESSMAGPGAFWINGPTYSVDADRPFAVMGFNYERGDAEMLHSLGHRMESSISRYFNGWNIAHPQSDWDRFTANAGQTLSGDYGVGSIHYPANGQSDYDYDNPTVVNSTAEDWLNYPQLTGATTPVSSASWAGGQLGYMNYWFSHLPQATGVNDETGRVNNWWKYAFDWTTYNLDGTPIVAPPVGDTNGDGEVNIVDLNNVRNNLGGTGLGDTDGDLDVDINDLNAVRNNFGNSVGTQPVPEPGSWTLLAIAAATLGFAGRRSSWRRGLLNS